MAADANTAARSYLAQFTGGAVTLEKDPTTGVAIITLDHPEKRNAMNGFMMVQLHDHIQNLEKWEEGKACILRGQGGNFCAGGDLDFAKASGNPEGSAIMNQWMTTTLGKLSALKMFTVCLAEGPTLGGGTEIALACDFILAADNLKFGVVHGKLGIVTAWGGGTRLTKRIGRHQALDLFLTSRILSAKECVEIGIAEDVIPSENAYCGVRTWLEPRLQHHYSVIRGMKEITFNAANLSSDLSYAEESRVFVPFWGGDLNKSILEKGIKHVKKLH